MKRRSCSFGFLSNALFWKIGNDKTVKAKNMKNTCLFALLAKIEKKKKKRFFHNSFACCSIMFSIMKNLIQKQFFCCYPERFPNIVHVPDTEKNKTRILSNFKIQPTRL